MGVPGKRGPQNSHFFNLFKLDTSNFQDGQANMTER